MKINSFEQLIVPTEKLVDFIRRKHIGLIVVSGASAKPALLLLREIWRTKTTASFPNVVSLGSKKVDTNLHYINAANQQLAIDAILAVLKGSAKKGAYVNTRSLSEQEIQVLLSKRLSGKIKTGKLELLSPVMVFDEHVFEGKTVFSIKNCLHRLGFSNIKIAALSVDPASPCLANKEHHKNDKRIDFVASIGIVPQFWNQRRTILNFDNPRKLKLEQLRAERERIRMAVQKRRK